MSTPTVRTFLGVTLSILFIWYPSLFAGLTPDTKITTPTSMIYIESLKVDDTIYGYGPTTHAFPGVKIKNIESVIAESIYVITTKHGTITASADQLFYEITSENFIPAAQLKPGHLFLTKAIKALECISVERKNTQTTVYDLTLEEPHLFFSSDAQVLTHNAIPILLLGIPAVAPVIKFVVSIGAIAGALYIEKVATSSLPIFAQCRRRRELKAARRALLVSVNQAEQNPTPSDKSQIPPQPAIENTTPKNYPDPDPDDDPNDSKKNDKKEDTKKGSQSNLENLDLNKINHIINGSKNSDHKWEKLVADKNWNDIKKIIKEVMEAGIDQIYKGNVKSKIKNVNGQLVEVTYIDMPEDIRKISNAWVK